MRGCNDIISCSYIQPLCVKNGNLQTTINKIGYCKIKFPYLCNMNRQKKIVVDIVIDKLTNSIENSISGDSFDTEILPFTISEKGYKKSHWKFNWIQEFSNKDRKVFKLVIKNNPSIIQGLISVSDNNDHIFVNLIENVKFNQGKNKLYKGVAGNLFAYACKLSFDKGYDGFVSFYAKSVLIDHYIKTLGAQRFGGLQLVLDTIAAARLISKYYNS